MPRGPSVPSERAADDPPSERAADAPASEEPRIVIALTGTPLPAPPPPAPTAAATTSGSRHGPCRRSDDCPSGLVCTPQVKGQWCMPPGTPPARCLAASSRIDTPRGPVVVSELAIGDAVWSLDSDGARVAVPLVAVGRRAAGTHHLVVRLVLSDGREVVVSPGHPLAGGGTVGALAIGDLYDGATVVHLEREPYRDDYTYDLLPGTATRLYWADGVLLGSTLDASPLKD